MNDGISFQRHAISTACILLAALIIATPRTLLAQENPKSSVNLNVVGVNKDNSRTSQDFNITVTQTVTLTTMPLLPYVFFNARSASIPSRYERLQDKRFFTERNLLIPMDTTRPIDQYYQILNIVGYRLSVNPGQSIQIIGRCSMKERNAQLARDRATTIQNYLHETFGIDRERIPVVVEGNGMLPSVERSSSHPEETDQEHQRVEFRGSFSIIGPVMLYDTLTTTDPPNLLLECSSTYPDAERSELVIKAGDRVVRTPRNHELSKISRSDYLWNVTEDEASQLLEKQRLTSQYIVKLKDGSERKSRLRQTPVKVNPVSRIDAQQISGERVNQFNLILFGFGNDNVLPMHDTILQRIESGVNIRPGYSRVIVTGYADNTGRPSSNREVAMRRANSVKAFLEQRFASIAVTDVPIVSETMVPKDSKDQVDLTKQNFATPESRMYNRTVHVKIITSAKRQISKRE